jgi:hypothetical protein
MATTSQRSGSKSGTAAKKRSSSASRSNSSRSTTSRSTSSRNGRSRASAAASKTAEKAGAAKSQAQNAASNGGGGGGVVPVVTAVAGAAAGVIGGVILGRKGKAPKKVLGVKVPGTGGSGFDGLADNVGNAAKQLGKLASEVREARQRAEKIGKALS